MPAAAKAIILLAKDKNVRKVFTAIFVTIAFLLCAICPCLTANNLQQYAQDTVAAEFAPIINAAESKITDGGRINSELLYATYIELFDNNMHSDFDISNIRSRLITCFYTTQTVKVTDISADGKPALDAEGKQTYHTETQVSAVFDSTQIFNSVQKMFSITISSQQRAYIIQLSQMITSYGSYAIGGNASAYTTVISQYCSQYGISGYENLILAIMQQESGGNGKDPMQASECGYNTRFPHAPNSITDPNYSIQCGVEQLASCLKAANCKSPNDMPGISLALQGYNFGNGFIPWAIGHGGYSLAIAQSFSQMESIKMNWSSYGDVNYVSHVLRYYSNGIGGSAFRYPIETGKYTITSGYGQRTSPTANSNEFHKGIDLAAPAGTPIYAAANGTVAYSQYGIQPYGGYGNIVIIRHSSSLISMYGHCSKLLVSVGQAVQKGQEIALVGSTGDSTGNHCHFEIRLNDKSVNPMSYLE